jgi:hypothetical protein
MRHHAGLCKTRKDLHKHSIEVAGCNGSAQRADLLVTGHLLHVESGAGVIWPCGMLQPALVFQKRRRLGAKEAQGVQRGSVEGVLGVGTRFAMVRQGSDSSVQDALEGIEASGSHHDYLLRSVEIDTLTMSASIGNLEPCARQNENCWREAERR